MPQPPLGMRRAQPPPHPLSCPPTPHPHPTPPHPTPPQDYELHANDCRHYINCLVKYTTGQDSAASATLQHRWRQGTAAGAYGLASGVVRLSQFVTDLANWGKVQLATSVGMYGALALSGHRALAALRPLAALPAGAKARLAKPVGRALAGPVRQALTRRPVVVGTTAAVATLAGASKGHAWGREGMGGGAGGTPLQHQPCLPARSERSPSTSCVALLHCTCSAGRTPALHLANATLSFLLCLRPCSLHHRPSPRAA